MADAGRVVGTDDQHQADAHVEHARHFGRFDFAQPCSQVNTGGTAQLPDRSRPGARRQDSLQVFVQPAAGDVSDAMHYALDPVIGQQLPHGAG